MKVSKQHFRNKSRFLFVKIVSRAKLRCIQVQCYRKMYGEWYFRLISCCPPTLYRIYQKSAAFWWLMKGDFGNVTFTFETRYSSLLPYRIRLCKNEVEMDSLLSLTMFLIPTKCITSIYHYLPFGPLSLFCSRRDSAKSNDAKISNIKSEKVLTSALVLCPHPPKNLMTKIVVNARF